MAPLGTIIASVGAVNLAARGFSYHDNNVRFIDTIKYSVDNFVLESESVNSGTFTVSQLSISSGQDPSNKNHVGDVHQMSIIVPDSENGYASIAEWQSDHTAYPGFTFTAGRHKTSDVAQFWNARIPPNQNTFGHTADELNFAFIGQMTLNTNHCGTMKFPSIGLAQGSDSTGSNWWFGGIYCSKTDDHKVTCDGMNSIGDIIEADFRRGGSGQIYDVFLDDCRVKPLV